MTVRWLDGTTEIGTGNTYSTSTLSSGNHNIFCEVSDKFGVKSLASISVLVNTLPTANITNSGTQYATAPRDLPIFLTTGTNLPITLTANSADSDGTISPENIRWYINSTGNSANDITETTFAGTGETQLVQFPVGVSTVTLRIYDNEYPEFEDQASATYKTAIYVWRSKSYQSPDIPNPSYIDRLMGNANKLYFTYHTTTPRLRGGQYTFDSGSVIGGESLLNDRNYNVNSFTVGIGLGLVNGITTIGSLASGSALAIASFPVSTSGNVVAPYNPSPDGLVTPISMTTEGSVIYVLDRGYTPNRITMINPTNKETAHFITDNGATGDNFSSPMSIRYSNKAYGKIFLADTGNNRICRFGTSLSGGLAPIPVTSPEDMAFSDKYVFALNKNDRIITILNPLTQQTVMSFGGTSGSGAGEFTAPYQIYFNNKTFFILDTNRLQIIQTELANAIE